MKFGKYKNMTHSSSKWTLRLPEENITKIMDLILYAELSSNVWFIEGLFQNLLLKVALT